MTFAEIKTFVLNFCKINPNTADLVSLIENAIDIAFYDTVREHKWPELLVTRVPISLATIVADKKATIPDHLALTRVRYKTTVAPIRSWALVPMDGMIPPAPIQGRPRAYRVVQDNLATAAKYAITLDPLDGVVASDILQIDYLAVPLRFSLQGDGTTYDSTMWNDEIIKRAEAYVMTYQNKLEQAKALWSPMMTQMNQSQQNATQSSN